MAERAVGGREKEDGLGREKVCRIKRLSDAARNFSFLFLFGRFILAGLDPGYSKERNLEQTGCASSFCVFFSFLSFFRYYRPLLSLCVRCSGFSRVVQVAPLHFPCWAGGARPHRRKVCCLCVSFDFCLAFSKVSRKSSLGPH